MSPSDEVRWRAPGVWTQVSPAVDLKPWGSILTRPAGHWPVMTSHAPHAVCACAFLAHRAFALRRLSTGWEGGTHELRERQPQGISIAV